MYVECVSESSSNETSQGPLASVVSTLRTLGTDTRHIEAKSAAGGLPKSLVTTLSAFSNSAGGGLVILGLDEKEEFATLPSFNATAIAEAVKDLVRQRRNADSHGKLSPTPQAEVEIVEFEGGSLVLVEVAELPVHQKPCYIATAGPMNGSYYRLHDGDHLYSEFEVYALQSNTRQPRDDEHRVEAANFGDLDHQSITSYLEQLRSSRPSVFHKLDEQEILVRTNVLGRDGKTPTLAGLLSLGKYPQQVFPQLMVTFAEYPGTDKGDSGSGVKLLNRATLDGSIPTMVDATVEHVLRSLKVRRLQRGNRIEESPEIPPEVIREAIANALMHRDYSEYSRGQQVRVELFSDRLVVSNAGGLYGGLTKEDIWKGNSSSRNAVLAKMLPDVPLPGGAGRVSENLGTGIQTMVRGLRDMGLDVPIINASAARFEISFPRYGLMTEEVRNWLEEIRADTLSTDHQRILALHHADEPLAVKRIRRRLGMDGEDVRDLLGELVTGGWLDYPATRGAAYPPGKRLTQLDLDVEPPAGNIPKGGAIKAVQLRFEEKDELSSKELAQTTGLHINTIRRILGQLLQDEWLEGIGAARSPARTYRKK